jgi:exodeoxyribonuclease VII small subunit
MAEQQEEERVDFEPALAELEQLVEQMERGDLSLEESLLAFERGVKLTRACQQLLSEAEQKVRILSESAGNNQLEEFTSDNR